MYQIIFYYDKNGKSEVQDYINYLREHSNSKDNKIKLSKITAYMRMLMHNGLSLGTPYIKHISNDIWELRPLKDRIFFAYIDNNNFILLSHFIKQTQKTPRKEISKAK